MHFQWRRELKAKRVEFIPDFGPGQVHLQTLWRDTHVHHVVCDRVTVAAIPAFEGVTFAHKRLQRPGAAHSRQQAVDRNGLGRLNRVHSLTLLVVAMNRGTRGSAIELDTCTLLYREAMLHALGAWSRYLYPCHGFLIFAPRSAAF